MSTAPNTGDLQADAKGKKGFVGSQIFPITGAASTQVETTSGSSSNGGLTVGGRGVNAKQTDHKVIEGSHGAGSDFRTKGEQPTMPANPGPREAVGQAPFGKNTPAGTPAKSFVGNLADSDVGN